MAFITPQNPKGIHEMLGTDIPRCPVMNRIDYRDVVREVVGVDE